MAKQLKVGDKVQIKKSSEYFDLSPTNPANVTGTVLAAVRDSTGHGIRVQWPQGVNSYRISDLKLESKPVKVKEDLLAEVLYTDACDDVLEVDTSMRGQVYIAAGQLDGDDDFESDKTVELDAADVKKLRKQLKAWLDKNHPTV
jgi:hypothetical protein